MRKRYCLLLLHFFLLLSSYAQDVDYNVNLISPELRKNANAVTRLEETKLVINNIGSGTLYHKYAITVFSEAGDKFATFFEYYDKFRKVDYVDGKLFDSTGKKIKTMKNSELNDISLTDGFSLADDFRGKVHNFERNTYPYTIEYTCSIDLNSLMFLPLWTPVQAYNYSVQDSKLTVECPADYKLRYKTFNYDQVPIITTVNNNTSYEWAVKSVRAISEERYSPLLHEITPSVLLAPTDFKMGDYVGNMNSWKDLGEFFFTLNQGRDVLPDGLKKTVHLLTDNIPDTINKIKVLYTYLQKNTRYVSVQLGIGGWQTFDANYVAKNDYGDCKALSNYMHSMLKEAGIKSNCTLINAGRFNTDFEEAFPSAHFNHVIVCVPMAKDTMWLECTSQTLPAGYLSGFTADRDALLIDERGSKLVHTPVYGLSDNIQKRNIMAAIDSEGNLRATINTQAKGMQGDHLHGLINGLSKDKINEYLKNNIDLPTYDVVKFNYKEDSLLVPSVYEQLELTANDYAQVSGKRLFITPNILTKNITKLQSEEERKTKIELSYEYADIDTVEIQIPAGYTPESIPADISIKNKFGNYFASVKVNGNKISYYRKQEQVGGNFPASDYADLESYYDKMYKYDRLKVVFIKSDPQ
ncbi:MAG TPA: DUF3857 domain-containing protein [Ferruginibacter sp.]|nr:DUF3857 domain-containing protein [Ferruginibacter sp.]